MLPFEMGPQFELDDDQYDVIDSMLRAKERNKGVVIGYHGTSASRAREIEKNGFDNRVAVDGRTGVFAWDESMKVNAKQFAKSRAKEDGDTEYAIIRLEMTNPEPDYLQGRNGEWKAYADNTKVLSIEYFPLDA